MGKDLKGKELGLGLRQRPDKRYEGRWTDGKGNKHSVYGKTLREVRQKLKEAELAAPAVVDGKYTVDEWFEIWYSTYKVGFIKKSSAYRYGRMYGKYILPEVGNIKLEDVTKTRLQGIITGMNEQGLSESSQNFVRFILTDMFGKAVEDNLIPNSPASNLRTGKTAKPDNVTLTKQQERDFLEISRQDFYNPLFGVQFNTGLRAGELFGLYPEDVDLDGGWISVKRTTSIIDGELVESDPKTQHSNRKIPINSDCRRYLEKWYIYRRNCSEKHAGVDCKFLFCNQHFRPMNITTYNTIIVRTVERVNLVLPIDRQIPVFRSHAMRRSFATRCFEADIPPKVVQKYMGHSSLAMTMDIYTKVFDDINSEMIEKISSAVVKNGTEMVQTA